MLALLNGKSVGGNMKKFTIPCIFPDSRAPFDVYVGEPAPDSHPLEQQAAWLLRERSGVIPSEVMNSFAKLLDIALTNNVSFEELTVYALGESKESSSGESGTS
jgi:hypothetical protein